MQDVERLKAAILEAVTNAPFLDFEKSDVFDNITPESLREFLLNTWLGKHTDRILNDAAEIAATAAISAMTPDTALHAGEDVGYVRGWNAAIDELERQDGFGEWADAAKFLRQLKKDTGNMSPKPPIL